MIINHILYFTASILILTPVFVFGQATFEDVTDEAGVGDTNGDINLDGLLDLYLVNLGQGNVFYLNNGDGAFDDVTGLAGVGDDGDGVGCAWGDYNNDGHLDLFVSNRPGADRLYENQGDTTFIDRASQFGMSDPSGWGESVAWGDYDNDGYLDLYKMRMQQSNILYHNIDGGDFEDVTSSAGVGHNGPGEGVAWCDYDGDGDLDIFATNANGYNLLYRNSGNGTFIDCAGFAGIREYGSSYGCAWGDYDNDGDFDLYVGRNGNNRLFRNNDDGTFDDASYEAGVDYSGWTVGVAWGDYDNDGWLDLHLAIHQGDDVLYRNMGDGTFDNVTDRAHVHNYYNSRGNIWGDFDGDGFLDLYVTNHDGAPNVLFQNTGNDNHFLHLALRGTESNSDGIGARVICVAGDLRVSAQVDGGSGFASQNSLPVEFGLGSNTLVDSINIYWPSGTVDILTDLQADHYLHIVEGGTVGIEPEDGVLLPGNCVLFQNYPNPFNPPTVIRYALPSACNVTIVIYDIVGRTVETLLNGEQPAGYHKVVWDAKNASSGMYFCRIKAGDYVETKKMVLLK
jgi:hypothetical protein